MDAILVYVQHSSDPEFVLKSMIVQGLDVPGAKSSLTVNVMECVPVVLQQIVKKNGERPVSIMITSIQHRSVNQFFVVLTHVTYFYKHFYYAGRYISFGDTHSYLVLGQYMYSFITNKSENNTFETGI